MKKKRPIYLQLSCLLFLLLFISCSTTSTTPIPPLSSETLLDVPENEVLKDESIYIITGGPGTGKTTLINALRDKKFICIDEAARQTIEDQMALGGDGIPWVNLRLFNLFVLNRMLEKFYIKQNFFPKQTVFFDRGLPDIIGYLNNDHQPIENQFIKATKKFRYNKKVFIAPPWKEIYVNDTARKESYEQSLAIYEELKKAYLEAGYELYELPKTNVKDRIDFVLKIINKK